MENELEEEFEMIDLGESQKFIGINIKSNKEMIEMSICQTEYIDNMLKRFDWYQVNNTKRKLREEVYDELNLMRTSSLENVPYIEIVASLLYLENATRPNTSYAVNVCSRYQINPTQKDYEEVKRIFRYLKGTRIFEMNFKA